MKIVIGSESFAPNVSGVAIATELLAENLAKSNYEVYVFAPSRKFKSHWEEANKQYKILRLRSVKNPFRKDFRVAFLPQKVIKKAIEKIKPDIIHLQDPTSICSSLRKVAKKNNIPIVITHHFSLDYVLSYLNYLKPIHRQIKIILKKYLVNFYNHCDYLICPTETIKKELKNWGIKTEITAISNGVDLERFFSYSAPETIYYKYHLPRNPIVLYVGRIDKDKNLDILIKAIPDVLKEINAHFVFVGIGDEIEKMEKLVNKLGIKNAVSFLGKIEHHSDDLPAIYQIATVFTIPSKVETQSIVTLEAMASGLPIVAADAGALPELVKNGENGYLVPPDEPQEMAQSLVKILKDENLRQKMKKRSLEIVSGHQIELSFTKIKNIYEKLVSSRQK